MPVTSMMAVPTGIYGMVVMAGMSALIVTAVTFMISVISSYLQCV
jgi:hypothetical protein